MILVGVILLESSLQPISVLASGETMQTAIFISENGSYTGTAPEEREMYYKLTLKESGSVTFTINVFQSSYAMMRLYDNEFDELTHKYIDYNENRGCAYINSLNYFCAGTYYLKICAMKSDANFSFTTNFESANETCAESQTSPNDILSQARTVSLNTKYCGLLGYDDDQDFYQFSIPFLGEVSFSYFNSKNGKYEILDEKGDGIRYFSNSYNYDKDYAEGKTTCSLDKGTYYLKVYKGYDCDGFYNFKIAIKPKTATINNGKRNKTKATIKINKVSGVTGYIVQYSTSEKFSKKSTKSKTVKSTSLKLSGLNKNKKYYVRVRSYKTWQGKTYYSSYSDIYVLY
jgi:hypothetical protein